MKISIIIPAYNEEAGIAASVRAALAQDYPDFEVIVVNNASTDRTAEAAEKVHSAWVERAGASGRIPPFKVVHESRKGLLWAREAGRQAATGEIITNMDADCLPDAGWLARGAAYFSDPRVAAVSGPYDYHDARAAFRNISLFSQKLGYRAINELFQARFIRRGAVLIGGNNMIRAAILRKCGGYDTSIAFYGEDTDTAKRVSALGRVIFTPALIMKTSARRMKAEGTFSLTMRYWYHFFRTIFTD